jgi:benzoate/toluate 1,2-dioxygenase alpha subunit
MEGTVLDNRFSSLVDDRPEDGVFRVDRSVYTDAEVFEAEMSRIYENGWVFLCHEDQVKDAGAYFATEIGRQPVFVIRQKDGTLKGFINACSHRGARLTACKQGKATVLTCRFHGWAYGCDGHCVKVKSEETVFPQDDFDRSRFDLTPVPRVESYRGFVFGSLNPDVQPIAGYLGAAAKWIDLIVEQSPDGLEVVPGSSTYTIYGNWKMQVENAVDGYHVSTVHRVFAATVRNREMREGITGGMAKTEGGRIAGQVPSGAYDLGNGHMSIWATHTTPEVRPVYQQKARLERELPEEDVRWILTRGRNLAVFPNVMIMDNPSTQIRVVKPVAPDRAEVTVYCIAPVGESREARAARLRKFEDFYLTFGMATSDDMAALEDSYEGSRARTVRWNDISNGRATMIEGPDEDAKRLGFNPASSNIDWMTETLFYGFYRRWRQMITVPGRNG